MRCGFSVEFIGSEDPRGSISPKKASEITKALVNNSESERKSDSEDN
jgi:hypothetical protein